MFNLLQSEGFVSSVISLGYHLTPRIEPKRNKVLDMVRALDAFSRQ